MEPGSQEDPQNKDVGLVRKDYKDVKARYGHEWTAGRAEYVAKLTGVPAPEKQWAGLIGTDYLTHLSLAFKGFARTLNGIYAVGSPRKPTRRMRTW